MRVQGSAQRVFVHVDVSTRGCACLDKEYSCAGACLCQEGQQGQGTKLCCQVLVVMNCVTMPNDIRLKTLPALKDQGTDITCSHRTIGMAANFVAIESTAMMIRVLAASTGMQLELCATCTCTLMCSFPHRHQPPSTWQPSLSGHAL